MSRRAALVTQADIARAIRAMRDAGLPVERIVVRPDGVAIETKPGEASPPREPEPKGVDAEEVVVL